MDVFWESRLTGDCSEEADFVIFKNHSGKLILASALSICLTGCMTPKKMDQMMSSWVGHSADDLIASWGPPQQTMPDGSEGQIFVYLEQRHYTTPGYSNTTSNAYATAYGNYNYATASGYGTSSTFTTPPQSYAWTVSRTFWINKERRIYRWAWRGL